jgi:hypothetical protein
VRFPGVGQLAGGRGQASFLLAILVLMCVLLPSFDVYSRVAAPVYISAFSLMTTFALHEAYKMGSVHISYKKFFEC